MPLHSPWLLLGLVLPAALVAAETAPAAVLQPSQPDWPQWLGPHRDGSYPSTNLSFAWPATGPAVLWKQSVGQGFSGPAVARGRLILFHRISDQEIVACLDANSGRELWKHAYPTRYRDDFGFDEGPRATPAVANNRVYTFGAEGVLHGLDLQSGKVLWRVDTQKDFGARKGFFGLACSPLVENDSVLVNIGGRDGAGIVAFDAGSGHVRWKATRAEASYSSPVAATIAGRRYCFFFNREGLAALDPKTGRLFFEFPWHPANSASVNAATPLVMGELVFISTSYGRGAAMLRFQESGPTTVWSGDDSLSCHYSSCVHHQGYLYGFDGRQEQGARLRCVDAKTGQVRWTEEGLGAGAIILAGDQLLILTERGELIHAPVSPQKFAPTRRAQVLGFGLRSHPALAEGLFFARDKTQLVCLDLRAP